MKGNVVKRSHRIGTLAVSLATVCGLVACSGAETTPTAGNETGTEVSTAVSTGASGTAATTQTRSAEGAVTVTDAAGRTLQFDELPERIVLAEGRAAYATALLQDNPLDNVVAYGQDL